MDVVDVTERLMAEFEDRLGLAVIAQVVRGCRTELDAAGATGAPELVERLARGRLLEVAATTSSVVPAPRDAARLP